MLAAGFLSGNILLEPLADKIGRKMTTYVSSLLVVWLNFKIAFGGTSASFFLELFFQGAFISVFIGNTIVYVMEICNPKQRSMFWSYVLLGLPISGMINE